MYTVYKHHTQLLWSLLITIVVLAGCGGSGGRNEILGTAAGAAAPPTVTTVTPADNAAGVSPVDPGISATFSEPMAPITGSASFTVTCDAPCADPDGTVSLDASGTVASFELAAGTELQQDTLYTATVTGAQSLATGLALEESTTWSFTTDVRPRVTAVAPRNSATGVPFNTTVIAAGFTEPMAPLTGDASFTVTCEAPCANPSGTVALDTTNKIASFTLTAASTLETATLYTATVTAGESLATSLTMANPFVWSFTTGLTADLTRPRVATTVPETTDPGPTPNVPVNTRITATFTEHMAPISMTDPGTFTVTCNAPCTSPAGTVSYAVGSQIATFSLSPTGTELEPGSTYTATITTAATDLAVNALAGNQADLPAASDYVWTFTTVSDVATPPADITVDFVEPADADIGVCPNATISATFDVSSGFQLDPNTIDALTFTVVEADNPLNTVTAESVMLDGANDIATFTPQDDLVDGTEYTARVKGGMNGIKDLAVHPNTMAMDFDWSFTVGSATGDCLQPPDLGAATPFAIAATAGVTNTLTAPITTINGDVVLDPVSGATCNSVAVDSAGGFGLCNGAPPILNGQVISPLFPDPGATSGAVKDDLRAAFLSITPPAGPPAAGSLGGATNIPAGTTLGAPTGNALVQGDNYFVPGVYQSLTSILITGDLTLDAQGNPNAVFIFQSSSTTGTEAGAPSPGTHTRILLIGGAKAANVFWQTGTSATLGSFTEFQGNILASESITMETGATSCGRLLAGGFTAGAFVFDSNVVSVPGPAGCP